jgi:hypothetical protein
MKAIILDTNIIIRYPRILSTKIQDTFFFTTFEIISEIGLRADNSRDGSFTFTSLLDLLQKSKDAGNLTISEINAAKITGNASLYNSNQKLSYVDKGLIALGIELLKSHEEVSIATQDEELIQIALKFQIKTLTPKNIQEIIGQSKSSNTSLEKNTKQYEKKESNKFLQGIALGILVTILTFVIYFNFKFIFLTINIWGTILALIIIGISLFVFREKKRLSYGIFEFLSGVGATLLVFYPTFNYSEIHYNFDFYAKILGGLYIMVRGQDNIVKSLEGKKWGLWLKEKTGIG